MSDSPEYLIVLHLSGLMGAGLKELYHPLVKAVNPWHRMRVLANAHCDAEKTNGRQKLLQRIFRII
jgi:hypothetical protein